MTFSSTISLLSNRLEISPSSSLLPTTNRSEHIPYPETQDLRQIKGMYHLNGIKCRAPDKQRSHHRINFHGTVEIYGTNITIVSRPGQVPQTQGRETVITVEDDNGYKAAAWVEARINHIRDVIKPVVVGVPKEVYIGMFIKKYDSQSPSIRLSRFMKRYLPKYTFTFISLAGELAGKCINNNQAAVFSLERFYAVFGFRINGIWLSHTSSSHIRFSPSSRVLNIHEFSTHAVTNDLSESRETGGGKNVSVLSAEVEKERPMALKLGGVRDAEGRVPREGILWVEERDTKGLPQKQMRFKSKELGFEKAVGDLPASEETNSNAEVFMKYALTAVSVLGI